MSGQAAAKAAGVIAVVAAMVGLVRWSGREEPDVYRDGAVHVVSSRQPAVRTVEAERGAPPAAAGWNAAWRAVPPLPAGQPMPEEERIDPTLHADGQPWGNSRMEVYEEWNGPPPDGSSTPLPSP